MREAVDRLLLLGDAAVVAREEKRFAGLESRLEALEEGVRAVDEIGSRLDETDRAVGKAVHRVTRIEERLGKVEASQAVGEAGHPVKATQDSHERPYLDLVTPEPLPDEADVYGEAAEMVEEWRQLRKDHPATRDRPVWVEKRMLELEIAMIDEFSLTLPPEAYPWDSLSRADQVHWRRRALQEMRRRWVWQNIRRSPRLVLMRGLWWK